MPAMSSPSRTTSHSSVNLGKGSPCTEAGARDQARACISIAIHSFDHANRDLPPIRVEPEIRAQTEAVLREGESLTQFIEDAVRKEVEWRTTQAAFVARAQAALEEHEESGGPTLAEVQARMQQRATKGAERIRAAVASRARAA